VQGLFQDDVDAGGKGRLSRDVSRGRKQNTSPNTILNEHIYTNIFQPEEPPNKKDILVTIALTRTIKRPAAGGNSAGNSAGQFEDHVGSSDKHDVEDQREDEDDEHPPAVIDKSRKSSFTREFAGLNRNLGSAREAPAGTHRRKCQTDLHCQRSDPLEIESAEAH
jgi:hypothetical protein